MPTSMKRTGQQKPNTIEIGNVAQPGNELSDAIVKIVSIPSNIDVIYTPTIK